MKKFFLTFSKLKMDNTRKKLFSYEYLTPKLNLKITLNEKEQKVFKLVKDVVEENKLGTTCRVAGGWVRDKVFFCN